MNNLEFKCQNCHRNGGNLWQLLVGAMSLSASEDVSSLLRYPVEEVINQNPQKFEGIFCNGVSDANARLLCASLENRKG